MELTGPNTNLLKDGTAESNNAILNGGEGPRQAANQWKTNKRESLCENSQV